MARLGPSFWVMTCAMEATDPLSSISLPNSAPSRNKREKLPDEARGTTHEGLGPVRQQRLAGEAGGDEGGDRRQQQRAPAPKCQPDEQAEAEQDAEQTHASDASR